MAGQPEHALIACEECGVLNEQATALLAEAFEHVQGLERDLRGKRSKISRLEGERVDKLRAHPKYKDAIEVLKYWQANCAPKAREIDNETRLTPTLARLSGGHTVEELKMAVIGYARKPFVTKQGRSKAGKPSEWYADAELIFRNPENVRRGIAMAAERSDDDEPAAAVPTQIERLSWRKVKEANRRYLLKELEKQYGKGWTEESFGGTPYRAFPCPACEGGALRMYDPQDKQIAECSSCHITDERLIAAITD